MPLDSRLVGPRRASSSTNTCLGRRGHDNGKIKDLRKRSMRNHLVPVESRVKVSGQLEEADLEIDHQEKLKIVSLERLM